MNRGPRPLVLIAAESDRGARLDRFLRTRSGVLSRMRARDLLAEGAVTLNGRRVKIASRPLHPGDRVEVHLPAAARTAPTPPSMPPYRVVYEDSAVLVVDKAPGILVQPTPQGDRGTLLDLLRRYLRRRHPAVRSPYLGLLHRIDRDTSGLLLFSRRGEANRVLAEQFRTHSLAREYLALVHGRWEEDSGTIADPLSRPAPGARRGTRAGGKRAVTHYKVLERFPAATLLSVTLETGRTHQIRIHFAGRAHPVVGDRVYGSREAARAAGLLDRFPRQALHAGSLGFTHPISGEWMSFEVPPPADFRGLLAALRGASA